MLSENELLEALAREIGVIMINCRTAELERDKLLNTIKEMEAFANSRELERDQLLSRLKIAEDARKELGDQIRGKNKTNGRTSN